MTVDRRVVLDARAAQGAGWVAGECLRLVRALAGHADAIVVDRDRPRGDELGALGVPLIDVGALAADPPAALHVLDVSGGRLPAVVRASATRIVAGAHDLRPLLADRTDHAAALALLRRADAVLAPSDAAAELVGALVPLAPWDVVVVTPPGDAPAGRPARAASGAAAAGAAIVCPAGLDAADGLAGVLAGYAALQTSMRRDHPLVVVGADPTALHKAAVRFDLTEAEVRAVSPASAAADEVLALAAVVVAPGHTRPAVPEAVAARAAGIRTVAPDGLAVARVVTDPRRRFRANDPTAARVALAAALTDPPDEHAVAPSSAGWGGTVARIIATYDAPADAAAIAARRPLALAFVTPLPPEPSGVATYDFRLAEALARRAGVTCFVPDPHSTTRPAGVTLASIAELAGEVDTGRFDEVLYAIGNHPRHGVELALLRLRPGAVLLHDVRLVGAYAGVHAPGDALADELQRVYPGRYPHHLLRSGRLEDEPSVEAGVWLVQEVAERATAVLTHSQHAADLVRADVAGRDGHDGLADALDVGPLAHPSVRVSPTPAPSGVVIVSAGVVHGSKQADKLVEAFGLLAARHPSASLWFAGPVEPALRAELTRRAGHAGIGPRVVFTGRLGSPDYERVVGGATVAVQLRESSNGESSAAVADVLALGVPTVVTDDGALAELPDEVAVKVPRSITARELADVLDALLGDASRRAALTTAARHHASEHGFDQAADRILRALFGPTRAAAHPPLAHETIHAS